MRKFWFIALGVLIFLTVFWLGLMVNFPGEAAARFLENKVNQRGGVRVRVSPILAHWYGFSTDSVQVSDPSESQNLWISLQNVKIPLPWGWLGGIPVRGKLGRKGRVELVLPWWGDEIRISAQDVVLEEIPWVAAQNPMLISGRVEMEGGLAPGPGPAQPVNSGFLKGGVNGFWLEGVVVMGFRLPPTRLDSIRVDISLDKSKVTITRLALTGDIEGDIHGEISPQWAQWMMSGLNLEVTLRISPEWIQKLGGLGGILTGYMNGDRLDVNIRGNLISPNIRQRE